MKSSNSSTFTTNSSLANKNHYNQNLYDNIENINNDNISHNNIKQNNFFNSEKNPNDKNMLKYSITSQSTTANKTIDNKPKDNLDMDIIRKALCNKNTDNNIDSLQYNYNKFKSRRETSKQHQQITTRSNSRKSLKSDTDYTTNLVNNAFSNRNHLVTKPPISDNDKYKKLQNSSTFNEEDDNRIKLVSQNKELNMKLIHNNDIRNGLEEALDRKSKELIFYLREIDKLQKENEKLLNCGYESTTGGKVHINQLILENNRLKEAICNRKAES